MALSLSIGLCGILLGVPTPSPLPTAAGARAEEAQCNAPYRLETKFPLMQRLLEARLATAGLSSYLRSKHLAVALVDLSRKGRRYYAAVNGDEMMYAASIPKIAILLAVVEAVDAGRIEWTHEFDLKLFDMITASNNEDASWATDLVGLLEIEQVLRDPRYCLFDDVTGGRWVGRAYRAGGATNPDPRFNITHGATARQVARFYTLLEDGKLVSPHWSFRMLGLMSPPAHNHKFVAGLQGRPGVVFLARKSGTWKNFHSDSALIQHDGRRYVAVALSELRRGEDVMRKVIGVLDDLVMDGSYRKASPAGPERQARR